MKVRSHSHSTVRVDSVQAESSGNSMKEPSHRQSKVTDFVRQSISVFVWRVFFPLVVAAICISLLIDILSHTAWDGRHCAGNSRTVSSGMGVAIANYARSLPTAPASLGVEIERAEAKAEDSMRNDGLLSYRKYEYLFEGECVRL